MWVKPHSPATIRQNFKQLTGAIAHYPPARCQPTHAIDCGMSETVFTWFPSARNGAQEGTRTLTPYGTRPSNVCVYQFHHLSICWEER